jgi:hypothetical protein
VDASPSNPYTAFHDVQDYGVHVAGKTDCRV